MSIPRISLVLVAAAAVLVPMRNSVGQKQSRRAAKSDEKSPYTYRKNHDPNGIGKFYMGREIAQVMSFHGARWLERAEREREERLTLLIRELKLKSGDTVADIGAGSGVITVMLADAVGEDGKVVAVDIQPEMKRLLERKLKRLRIDNVETVLGTVRNPRLKPESVDLVLLVDVYHEFEFPEEMLVSIAEGMKTGGRLVLVEYRMEDPRVPIKLVHKMSEAQVKKEVQQAKFPFKWKQTIKTLPRQHVVVFEKVGEGASTESSADTSADSTGG